MAINSGFCSKNDTSILNSDGQGLCRILVVGHLIMVKVFSKNVKSVTKAAADA